MGLAANSSLGRLAGFPFVGQRDPSDPRSGHGGCGDRKLCLATTMEMRSVLGRKLSYLLSLLLAAGGTEHPAHSSLRQGNRRTGGRVQRRHVTGGAVSRFSTRRIRI